MNKSGTQNLSKSKILEFANKFIAKNKKNKKKTIEIEESSRALYIFSHDNRFRLFLKKILENPYFEGFIYHMIFFNSILLALEEPVLSDPYQKKTIALMLNIVSAIFIFEFVFKIIVHGFCIGPKTYLKDNFNKLDFVIVIFTFVNWILDFISDTDLSFVKGFRALRALRPLRMVSKNEGK
jgi:hypothetical protein